MRVLQLVYTGTRNNKEIENEYYWTMNQTPVVLLEQY